jgi:hypothetical protein
MNRGAGAFKALAVPAKIWAARLGKSVSTIRAYTYGERVPPEAERVSIHADWNGPAPELWLELVTEPSAPRTQRELPEPEAATPEAAEGEAAKLLQNIRGLQDEIAGAGADMDLQARVRMVDHLASAVAKLGQLTGTRVTERAILASPHFAEIESTMIEALTPWPDAMRAVSAALEGLRAK